MHCELNGITQLSLIDICAENAHRKQNFCSSLCVAGASVFSRAETKIKNLPQMDLFFGGLSHVEKNNKLKS